MCVGFVISCVRLLIFIKSRNLILESSEVARGIRFQSIELILKSPNIYKSELPFSVFYLSSSL